MFPRQKNKRKKIPISGNLSASKNWKVKLSKDNRFELQEGQSER